MVFGKFKEKYKQLFEDDLLPEETTPLPLRVEHHKGEHIPNCG